MSTTTPTTDTPGPFTYQVLVMPSDEGFEAVALEMGQWGFGDTPEEAFEELVGNVEAHVADAVEQGQLELLDRPAPERYQVIARDHLQSRRQRRKPDSIVKNVGFSSASGASSFAS